MGAHEPDAVPVQAQVAYHLLSVLDGVSSGREPAPRGAEFGDDVLHAFRRGQAECGIEGPEFVSLDVDFHECDDSFRVAQETVDACGVHALGCRRVVHNADARIQAVHVDGSPDRVGEGLVALDCDDIASQAGGEEREGAVIGSNIKENA